MEEYCLPLRPRIQDPIYIYIDMCLFLYEHSDNTLFEHDQEAREPNRNRQNRTGWNRKWAEPDIPRTARTGTGWNREPPGPEIAPLEDKFIKSFSEANRK